MSALDRLISLFRGDFRGTRDAFRRCAATPDGKVVFRVLHEASGVRNSPFDKDNQFDTAYRLGRQDMYREILANLSPELDESALAKMATDKARSLRDQAVKIIGDN